MTSDEIKSKSESFKRWYHAIELFPGYVTPSNMTPSMHQWEQVRKVREKMDYKGKSVLDLGTMDGMWAFEAEKLGAKPVYALFIWNDSYGSKIEVLGWPANLFGKVSGIDCLP